MFTGLIDDVGVVDSIGTEPAGRVVRIRSRYEGLTSGESISVNGVCLTVREHGAGWFSVAAVETTLGRTTVGDWKAGSRLNLERAMLASGRLGGHLVAGHVDAVAQVSQVDRAGDALLIALAVPSEVMELCVLHGSIAIDGVSLTINALPADGSVQLSLIEYTLRHTTLGGLRAGELVNVETDLIGKYVQRLMQPYQR